MHKNKNKNKNPPYMHIKIILFIMLGDPNNIKEQWMVPYMQGIQGMLSYTQQPVGQSLQSE